MVRFGVCAALSFLPLSMACFEASFPEIFVVTCRDGRDCVDDTVCLLGDEPDRQRCVRSSSGCIDVDGRTARALPDGSVCGDENICIAAACVAPRCGDGVVTAPESCDGGADCRSDCTRPRCGDGVIDTGEKCDDGNVENGDGCRSDCAKVERCGDGVVDDGESCDDANSNPRDGCDDCLRQRWSAALVVSGAIEPREGALTALGDPTGIAFDPLGRLLIADTDNNAIRRLETDGTLTTVAGTGFFGAFSGDGGPATSAPLPLPVGVAVDPLGRVIVAETESNRVRRLELDGTIATIAGNNADPLLCLSNDDCPPTFACALSSWLCVAQGAFGLGDGGPATSAPLYAPFGVAVDHRGRVLIADTGNLRVRRVEADGTITTLAGNGLEGFSGEGGPATSASVMAAGIAVDPLGRVVIADAGNHRVRRVDLDGIITTIAGTGEDGFAGDGGPATNAALSLPVGVAVDPLGRVFIACVGDGRIRRVDVDGTITTIAGTGEYGFAGDGGPATSATLSDPSGVAIDPFGRVLIADRGNNRIRRVDADGFIATIAGTGSNSFSGDGGPATSAAISATGDFVGRAGIAVDPVGRLFIAATDERRICRVDLDGTITTIVGTGETADAGDDGPPTGAAVRSPAGVAVDALGRLLFADAEDNRVRRVELDGSITTIAGGGGAYAVDGVSATDAYLNFPEDVAVDSLGRVLIADTSSHRILRVELDGTLSTLAGNSNDGFLGDGGPATSAALSLPSGVAVDARGRVLIADTFNSSIRRVELDGTISTIAGNGEEGFSGDDGPATSASLYRPTDVTVDLLGRVLIADSMNYRIRRVELDGTITTLAGTGESDFSGDGGAAKNATLSNPTSVAVDSRGRVLIADVRVRRVDENGIISTVAGRVHPAGPGPAAQARLYPTSALVEIPDDALIAVGELGRALRIDLTDSVVDVAVGYGLNFDVIGDFSLGFSASSASSEGHGQAPFAPLLEDPRGVAFDPVGLTLVITEQDTGDLRVIGLDPDNDGVVNDASAWTNRSIATDLTGPAGIVYDAAEDGFVVVDERDHCVKRVGRDGAVVDVVVGRCGTAGLFPGFLNQPTHAVASQASGAIYVADTGNHRVLRVDGAGGASLVLGDGSVSSAGEGSPARLFPVNAPRQLALDRFGNLYVASTTALRLVANVDGDDDADGDDRVTTVFGGGTRETFPESVTFCLDAIVVTDVDRVFAADACQGFMVELVPTFTP
jgi:cysteine-rich repeat protein